MLASVPIALRAGVAFALSTAALIPLSLVALLVGASSDSSWVSTVAIPVFFTAQWAFPRSLQGGEPYRSAAVPTLLLVAVWLAFAVAFGIGARHFRIRRLWFAAPMAVLLCVLLGNVILYLSGFNVTLDGP